MTPEDLLASIRALLRSLAERDPQEARHQARGTRRYASASDGGIPKARVKDRFDLWILLTDVNASPLVIPDRSGR
jgi:hypothetical protein